MLIYIYFYVYISIYIHTYIKYVKHYTNNKFNEFRLHFWNQPNFGHQLQW